MLIYSDIQAWTILTNFLANYYWEKLLRSQRISIILVFGKYIEDLLAKSIRFQISNEYTIPIRRGLVGNVLGYYTKRHGSSPRPDIKTKYKMYFFADFLSADFWQKLLRVN